MSAVATNTAWYAYGVVDAERGRALPDAAAGIELRMVEAGALAAVSSVVSLDEFGEEPLRENLNDRVWLEQHARAHEDVLLAVAAVADVVPFRFGTICRTDADLRALLRERESELTTGLARIRRRVELGVKIWVDRVQLGNALSPSTAEPAASAGRAYLEARRAEQRRNAEAEAFCDDIVRDAYGRLAAHAVDSVVNRPQPRELTGRSEQMLLNAAFLVESESTGLRDEVEALNGQLRDVGISLELTGPWPAHNFVGTTEGEA